jgi:hypothetical protein
MTSLLLIAQEAEEGAVIEAENRQYEALLASKVGNDGYLATGVQTLDNLMLLRKHKEVQTLNAESLTVGTQWDVRSIAQAAGAEAAAVAAAHAGSVAHPQAAALAPHNAALAVRLSFASSDILESSLKDVYMVFQRLHLGM